MKRNSDDHLFNLAFGEFSESERAELEANAAADPAASAQLRKLRNLKADLRSLADVPPDQLSNDRLRDAILGQGLKPRQAFDWSWVWMPALSCVLVAGLMVGVRHRSVGEPSILGTPALSLKDPGVTLFPHDKSGAVAFDFTKESTKVNDVRGIAAVSLRHPVSRKGGHGRAWRRRHGLNGLYANVILGTGPGTDENDLGSDTSALSTASLPVGGATSASDTRVAGLKPVDNTPATPAVVVIEPDKDKDSGTQQAREVGNSKNVVIGG